MEVKRRSLLSTDDCRVVHEGSCRLLEETGIETENREAVQIFVQNGAVQENGRIKIPRAVLEEFIKKTGTRIELGAKNVRNAFTVEAGVPRIFFGTGGQALYVLEKENDHFQRRSARTEDLINILKLCEQLDHVDFITRPVEPDVPEEDMDLEKTRLFIQHTTKHMNLANLIRLEKLPEILNETNDRSLVSFISCVCVSPLKLVGGTLEKFLKIVEEDIPVSISSCPQAGLTAPLSELGELIQVNAEVLSAVVLANMVKPGARIFYRGIPITSNLHEDVSPRWCQPESIRRISLVTDMSYFYGIPCCGTAAVSDEKEPTAQAVSEKTLSWIYEAAGGASFINSALGMLEQVMTVSPEQYIMDDRILASIKPLFELYSDKPTSELAQTAVNQALELYGVNADSGIKEEIYSRIQYIEAKREEYSTDAAQAQVDAITKAVLSGKSSSIFMKASRSGLRKGLLYMGDRIEVPLDLSAVDRDKKSLLADGRVKG
jgi:trimethylamine--corrinoid protein Co-methyltransferase